MEPRGSVTVWIAARLGVVEHTVERRPGVIRKLWSAPEGPS
jgi:hypothetical protein